MYWKPYDSAHSGRINSSSGRAAILGFILAGRLWVVGFFFFKAAGGTRVQAVILKKQEESNSKAMRSFPENSPSDKTIQPAFFMYLGRLMTIDTALYSNEKRHSH